MFLNKIKTQNTSLSNAHLLANISAVFIFLFSFIAQPFVALAQEQTDDKIPFTAKFPQIQEQLVTEVEPETPKPGDIVTIDAETYSININTQLITWKVNGKEMLKGIGKKTFSFQLGQSGETSVVDVYVTPTNAPEITKRFTFSPIDVDILWQANTYTPPFYKGKALFTPESNVTFVAMPNIIMKGKRVDPSDVVYNWKVDREVDGDNSGFGKNSYDFTGSIILRPTLIQAEVYAAADDSVKGLNGFTLTHTYPQALAYENNPLYGILFNKAVRNQYTSFSDAVELDIYPYFFSTDDKNANVAYNWSLDGNATDIPQDQNSALFKRKADGSGSAEASIVIGNPNKILQKAVAALGITFADKKTEFGQ